MRVLVKLPTRGRPELFKRTFALYRQDEGTRFLVTLDADDETADAGFIAWLRRQPETDFELTVCKSKIEAINHGLAAVKWDLLICGADDMLPLRPDYAAHIVTLFADRFPQGDGVLHLNDGRTGRTLNTLPILDRAYFNRRGYVYHPDYLSLWADNEFQAVSERDGRAAYVDEVVIRHAWTEVTGRDALHLRNESFTDIDLRTFERRRQAGFP